MPEASASRLGVVTTMSFRNQGRGPPRAKGRGRTAMGPAEPARTRKRGGHALSSVRRPYAVRACSANGWIPDFIGVYLITKKPGERYV